MLTNGMKKYHLCFYLHLCAVILKFHHVPNVLCWRSWTCGHRVSEAEAKCVKGSVKVHPQDRKPAGKRRTGPTGGCVVCLPNRNSRGCAWREGEEEGVEESINILMLLCHLQNLCVCEKEREREHACEVRNDHRDNVRSCQKDNISMTHVGLRKISQANCYSRHKAEPVFIFIAWPLIMIFCQVNTLVGKGVERN